MLPARRIEFVTRLVEAIKLIGPATQFEPFGNVFMHHWKKVDFISTGINVQNNPITRNADSVSPDGSMVAEYSAEKGYFGGRMLKARGDLKHARAKNPEATEIYLLSSQVASDGQRQRFPRLAERCKTRHGVLVQVLDARRLAELIVDHLLVNDAAVDGLSPYVPKLKHIQDEYASSDAIPTLAPNHVARPSVQAEITGVLAEERVISIVGLAGNGKSVSAAAFAQASKDEFDLVIWLDASSLKNVNDLKSHKISRIGESRNVLTLLANQKSLLVLDDISVPLPSKELAELCGPHSRVIVTRRDAPNDGRRLDLALMTPEEATALLNSGEGPECPVPTVAKILDAVGGHPFSLAMMNAFVRTGTMTWPDVEHDCAAGSAPNLAYSQERIADRILSRVTQALERELEIFRWIDQSRCDRGWFDAECGKAGDAKLRRHGLVSPDRGGVVRVHDIVFGSISVKIQLGEQAILHLIESLNDYIESTAYSDDLAFTSLAFTLAPKLHDLVTSGVSVAGIVYAWLRSWDAYDRDLALLGDPMSAAKALAASGSPPGKLDVAVILEGVEIKYRHLKIQGTTNEAKDWLRESLDVYDVLAAIPGLDSRSRVDILHHRGKALNLTFKKQEAIEAFEAVLASQHPLHESRLQLVRLYAWDKPERALELAGEVFKAASEGSRGVTSSVLLATAEALPWGKLKGMRRQYMEEFGDLIEARLVSTVESGSDQAYTNFASVGRDWAWHEPERYARIYPHIPTRALDEVKRDNDRFTYADIRREGAETAIEDPAAKEAARIEALAFFQAMEKPNAFHMQKFGQLYVEWGKYADAAATLERITPANDDRFRKLWLSKAYVGLGRAKDGLDLIEDALAATKDDDPFLSTFTAQRFEARHALNDPDARSDLDRAIELSASETPRERLVRRKEAIFGKA